MKPTIELKCMRCEEKNKTIIRKPNPFEPSSGRMKCLWCDTEHHYIVFKKKCSGMDVITKMKVIKEGLLENYSKEVLEKMGF